MGYGDTVPATGFGAAGMTYEKGSASPTELRVDQQFRTHWATVKWASENRRQVLDGWANIWRQAEAEGEDGILQPNEVVQPTNEVQFPVPDIRIRNYFLSSDRALGDVRKLVERLRRMDVEVYRLKAPLRLANARVFGGRSAPGTRVPGRLLLDPDGPAAEALDPGDAGRGSLRPVPVLLRRLVVEQPAADGRADALHR